MEFRWIDKEKYVEGDRSWSPIEADGHLEAVRKAVWLNIDAIGERYGHDFQKYIFSIIIEYNSKMRVFDIDVQYEPKVNISTNGVML